MRAAIIILVALGALITLGFLAVFLVSSRPWASPIGRNQLALPLVLFGLLALLLVRWIVGPLSAWAWMVGLALLDLVMLWRLIILVRLQLDERRQAQE